MVVLVEPKTVTFSYFNPLCKVIKVFLAELPHNQIFYLIELKAAKSGEDGEFW